MNKEVKITIADYNEEVVPFVVISFNRKSGDVHLSFPNPDQYPASIEFAGTMLAGAVCSFSKGLQKFENKNSEQIESELLDQIKKELVKFNAQSFKAL